MVPVTRRARNAQRAGRISAAARRLVAIYDAAPESTRRAGRGWYPAAYREAAAMMPADPARAAAVIAALSPQVTWRANLRAARAILRDPYRAYGEGGGIPGYAANLKKAAAIAAGAPYGRGPGDGFGGPAPKVRAFHAAICGDLDSVTLDVWAMRAAGLGNGRAPAGRQYAAGASAYRAAARRVGIPARDLQAIVWIQVRGYAQHAADEMARAQLALLPEDWSHAMDKVRA
jgi:hypothetical protein